MGGVGGHLNHLYDDRSMTFDKMMDIIDSASRGKLQAEEKVDGQNLFISWSEERQVSLAARNKGNLKQGGMDAAGLAAKFAGRGAIEKTYNEAFNTFDAAVKAISPEDRIKIFGQDATKWYNIEVMSPENPNVILYDKKILKIHSDGHKILDDNKAPQNYDANSDGSLQVLDNNLKKMQDATKGKEFEIARKATLKLKALSDDKSATDTKTAINNAVASIGLQSNAAVEDYLKKRLTLTLDDQVKELPEEKRAGMVARILRLEGFPNLTKIKKGLTPEQKETVSQMSEPVIVKQMMANAIQPIELAIHEFAVEVLKTVQSVFVLDPRKEVDRLRSTLSKTVTDLEAMATDGSISAEEMDAVRIQLRKIGGLDRVTTSAEGMVFVVDGMLYKFTGNFAPINQVLGILKYGRIKTNVAKENILRRFDSIITEAIETVNEADPNGKRVAFVPGAFKPPHAGHYLGARSFAEMEDIDEVRVLISPGTRDGITVNQSKRIWELYIKNDPDKSVEKISLIVPPASPVRYVYDMIEDKKQFKPGDSLVLGQGEKESGAAAERLASFAERKNPGVNVEYVKTKMYASGVSGTQMRELVLANNEKEFKKHLPDFIRKNDDLADQAWTIATGVNELQMIDDVIDEMAGAHAVGGYGAPLGIYTSSKDSKRKKKKKTTKSKRR